MIAHCIRLDADTDRELAELAEELRTSEADVVRRAVKELARRELPPERKNSRKNRQTDLTGR